MKIKNIDQVCKLTTKVRQSIKDETTEVKTENLNKNDGDMILFLPEDTPESQNIKQTIKNNFSVKNKIYKIEDVLEGKFSSDNTLNKVTYRDNIEINTNNKVDSPNNSQKIICTNTLILNKNKIKTLEGINISINKILPKINDMGNELNYIQWIDLSNNLLTNVHADILKFRFLKILYLHNNYINELSNITCLKNLKSLSNITLFGNGIEKLKSYRQYLIELLPTLNKIDHSLVSDKELDIAFYKASYNGEKRNQDGVIVKYPKLDKNLYKQLPQPTKKKRDPDEDF